MSSRRTTTKFSVVAALLASLLFLISARPARAAMSLNFTYSANAPSSTMNGIAKQIRVDPTDGKVYTVGTSVSTFLQFSVDGSSATAITYSSNMPASTNMDFVISNGQMFLNPSGGTLGLYRYDISGANANFVASSAGVAGSASIALGPGGTIYANKGNALVPFDYLLNKISPTTTLSSASIHMGYAGTKIYYITSAGRIGSNDFLGTDVAIINTGFASAKGLSVSSDASAIYYATSTGLRKILASNGGTLWTKSTPGIASFDLNTSTGKMYTVDGNGTVQMYDPINPVSAFTASSSGSDVTLSITNGAVDSDFGGTLIRRSTLSYPATVTDGSAVTTTASNTFVDSGLSNATYYYTAFNKTSDGYYSSGVTSSVVVAASPDAPILASIVSGNSVSLSWNVPVGTNAFVLRRSSLEFPASQSDGTAVTSTDASTINFTDVGLADGTYYYSIFAADALNNYSSAGTASVTIDTTPPSRASNFSAVASGSTITLDWTNPVDADFSYQFLRRGTTGFPATPSDGTPVTTTLVTHFVNTALSEGTYYFSLFAYDLNGNYSSAATASASVDNTAPTLTLLGSSTVTINQGSVYTDAGATASDAIAGNLTGSIVTTGSVNTSVPGTNTITYNVSDSSGNVATPVSRTVTVVAVGGGVAPVVMPSASGGSSLSFNVTPASTPSAVKNGTVQFKLNADPRTVKGYAVSLDPQFKNTSIVPLADSEATFTLPTKPGTYTVYLKYFSTTGQPSAVLSQNITYAPSAGSSKKLASQTLGTINPANFKRTQTLGTVGADVKQLQIFLNTHGYVVAANGAGSPGRETTVFGVATQKALIRFQEANANTILRPAGLKKGTGLLGTLTIQAINEMLKK